MNNLKSKILAVLKKYPYTRNSDINLTLKVWELYYPGFIKDGKIKLEMMHYLPRESHITRLRAEIQHNMGLYTPTCLKVAYNRNMKQSGYKQYIQGEA